MPERSDGEGSAQSKDPYLARALTLPQGILTERRAPSGFAVGM